MMVFSDALVAFTLQTTEPTEDWKMEEVMHWWQLRAHSESEAVYEEMVSHLSKQLEEGKTALWDDHKQVKHIIANENADPQQQHQLEKSEDTAKPSNNGDSSSCSDTIHIEIVSGEYEGATYDLQPKPRALYWVGRSQGKKFRKGISLPKDLEVSTTHGRFEMQGNKFFYVDTGSTNGSRIGEALLEANQLMELKTGMEVIVGQTTMRVTVPF
jgi:hypothetical protein